MANNLKLTVNEKNFIESAILSELRVDGRRLYDYRRVTIQFGSKDGSAEVQLGQTHVVAHVTGQLVQPYRDRSNEGSLSIYTEFSPMADPAFEAGRPGESAIELGRVIDRGLRESKAVDMESLCVVPGKSAWAIRVDIHILDNGGNLIDAANIAALAALKTFRRPECSLGGENNQEVIVHEPEVREPYPLTIHFLPVAVTFAFFGEGNIMAIDPMYKEEAVMGGRMTVTLNENGDICSIQKAGGEGVTSNVIMACLRIATLKVKDITSKINSAVKTYEDDRVLKKVKRHSTLNEQSVNVPDVSMKESQFEEFTKSLENEPETTANEDFLSDQKDGSTIGEAFMGGPSNWDPYSSDTSLPNRAEASHGTSTVSMVQEDGEITTTNTSSIQNPEDNSIADSSCSNPFDGSGAGLLTNAPKSLKDAVKKKKKKNEASSTSGR